MFRMGKMAFSRENKLALAEVFCLFFGVAGCILIKIDHKQPEPYMDEIFHVPQVQKYCEGRFGEWDAMITTLPGLYIVTLLIFHPLSLLMGTPLKILCTTFWLRSVNIAFSVGNFILLLALTYKLHAQNKEYSVGRWIVTSVTLATFPLLYFFTFLYYTDVGSTFCVLLMYLLTLHQKHVLAATAGLVAVLFRQTNIVWVVFCAGLTARQILLDSARSSLERKHAQKAENPDNKENIQQHDLYLHLLKSCRNDLKESIAIIMKLAMVGWPYALVVLAFCAFVFINGGIVVGAKDDHQATLHFPQLFYFASFSAAFAFVHLISVWRVQSFLEMCYRKPLFVALCCAVCYFIIWKYTFAHRYLLADNRHYPFYLWAKVYRRHDSIKYLLIPGYLFAIWTIAKSLEHKDVLWKLVYVICLVVNLVPFSLFEFRYFIVPYLFLRLNMNLASFWKVGTELTLYLIVNVLTIYVFLERPFKWQGESQLQRFMW